MRHAFAALLLALSLLLPGCAGSGPATQPAKIPAGNASAAAAEGNIVPVLPQQPETPPSPAPGVAAAPNADGGNASAAASAQEAEKGNGGASAPAARPAYVDYCYPTYWKGTLNGTGHNYFSYNRCGDYDYSMQIDVLFTMPFDLAAYLARKDFNFNDCPGMPEGAANGSRDISIGGSFASARRITSPVFNRQDRVPDSETTSQGALYVSKPHGLALATYPRQQAKNASWKAPHLVADRCTWDRGIQVLGYDEAVLLGADAGGFSYSKDMRAVSGKWAVNSTLAGSYTLERTN